MKNMSCSTEYTTSAMFSDMAFSARNTAACTNGANGANRKNVNNNVRGTALAVSLFAFIFLVSVFAGVIGVLYTVSLYVLSVVFFIYIIDVRIIIPRHGKAYTYMKNSVA